MCPHVLLSDANSRDSPIMFNEMQLYAKRTVSKVKTTAAFVFLRLHLMANERKTANTAKLSALLR